MIYWAAVRSGLYITAVNHHLSAPEAAYIVDDCGAEVADRLAPTSPSSPRRSLGDHPGGRRRLAFGGPVDGPRLLRGRAGRRESRGAAADQPARRRHALLLGHHRAAQGHPAGAARPPGRRARRHDASPSSGRCSASTSTPSTSRPAPIYHAAPLRFGGWCRPSAARVVLMAGFDAAGRAGRDRASTGVTHSQWVPTMFVRMLKLDEPCARRTTCPVDAGRDPRRRAVPGRGQAAMIDWWGPIL